MKIAKKEPTRNSAVDVKPLVLIAEDVPIQAKKLQFYLEKFGYDVVWAMNGREGLEHLQKRSFDLIITDVQMPEMDGLEFLTKLRLLPTCTRIPVIVLTTLTDEDVCLTALREGASEFLNKPFKPEECKLRCRNLISLYRYENLLLNENLGLSNSLVEKNIALEKSLCDLQIAHELLKATQAKLVQTSKLASLGVLGGGIAHEINTPLASISLCSELLNRTIVNEDLRREDIKKCNERITRATNKIAKIVEHLKVFARTGDSLNQSKKDVSMNEILDNLDDFYAQFAIENKITIHKKFLADLPLVAVSQVAIEHVFLNLVHNALDSMIDAGKRDLTLITSYVEDKVVVQVQDTGCGISPDSIARIYDPFYTTKDVGQGVGLGLSVVRAYLMDANGDITCKSELGVGSTFTVTFHPSRVTRMESHDGPR